MTCGVTLKIKSFIYAVIWILYFSFSIISQSRHTQVLGISPNTKTALYSLFIIWQSGVLHIPHRVFPSNVFNNHGNPMIWFTEKFCFWRYIYCQKHPLDGTVADKYKSDFYNILCSLSGVRRQNILRQYELAFILYIVAYSSTYFKTYKYI